MKERHDRRLFAGMVADLADLHLSDKFIDLLKTRRLTRPCSIDLPHTGILSNCRRILKSM